MKDKYSPKAEEKKGAIKYSHTEGGKERSIWLHWKVHKEGPQEERLQTSFRVQSQPEDQNEKCTEKLINLYH